jgi:hypothetical protein
MNPIVREHYVAHFQRLFLTVHVFCREIHYLILRGPVLMTTHRVVLTRMVTSLNGIGVVLLDRSFHKGWKGVSQMIGTSKCVEETKQLFDVHKGDDRVQKGALVVDRLRPSLAHDENSAHFGGIRRWLLEVAIAGRSRCSY